MGNFGRGIVRRRGLPLELAHRFVGRVDEPFECLARLRHALLGKCPDFVRNSKLLKRVFRHRTLPEPGRSNPNANPRRLGKCRAPGRRLRLSRQARPAAWTPYTPRSITIKNL